MKQRVVITGMGALAPGGIGVEAFFSLLKEGRSGVSLMNHYDVENFHLKAAGQIKDFEPKDFVPASFPNLKPTAKSISLRMPNYLLTQVKENANAIDIPYQALIKKYIADGLKREK